MYRIDERGHERENRTVPVDDLHLEHEHEGPTRSVRVGQRTPAESEEESEQVSLQFGQGLSHRTSENHTNLGQQRVRRLSPFRQVHSRRLHRHILDGLSI